MVGEAGGNILEVSHNRMMMDMTAKSADLGLIIEARDAAHGEGIKDALKNGGFVLRRLIHVGEDRGESFDRN